MPSLDVTTDILQRRTYRVEAHTAEDAYDTVMQNWRDRDPGCEVVTSDHHRVDTRPAQQ
jgi:hypothetical protein